MGELIGLGTTLLLVALGFFAGRWNEGRHLRSLAERERALASIAATNLRSAPPGAVVREAFLVQGSVVLGIDYWKLLVAGIRNFVGGRIRGYESLLERARREATARMLEEARSRGARAVCNVRYETSTIGGGAESQKAGGSEILAYGTALVLD